MYKTIVSNNADMVICDYFLVKNNKEILIKQRVEYEPKKCIRYLLTGELEGFTWNKLIRKNISIKIKLILLIKLLIWRIFVHIKCVTTQS